MRRLVLMVVMVLWWLGFGLAIGTELGRSALEALGVVLFVMMFVGGVGGLLLLLGKMNE